MSDIAEMNDAARIPVSSSAAIYAAADANIIQHGIAGRERRHRKRPTF
ncbi:MAG: hypothetical protein ABW023_01475 [Sphingomonas sp.]